MREYVHRPASEPVWVELAPPKAKPQQKLDKSQDQSERRIVQSSEGREEKVAAPDSFLGEKTRVVDRQTVNAKKSIEMAKTGATQSAKQLTQTETQAHQSQPKGETQDDAHRAKALSSLGLAILPEARRKGAAEELNKDQPQWANIGSRAQDYVEGVKQSDRTALNTREYLYYGYHQRIRQRLELEWTRLLREVLVKFYRGGRQLANDTEYTTKLLVILNSQGEITKIKVLGMSGTQELDDVAISAFNKAGPFPNPPKGLVQNGEVEVPWELKLRS